jgi:hypothetical protein
MDVNDTSVEAGDNERVPATFVLAGVDIEGTGLFAGRRSGQIAGRYSLITTSPFRYRTAQDQRAWHALVATLEESLRLHAHRPGTLVRLGSYLHERTGGMIGSLSHLIREAALDALLDGTEKSPGQGWTRSTSTRPPRNSAPSACAAVALPRTHDHPRAHAPGPAAALAP